jgi:alpha-glucosidase
MSRISRSDKNLKFFFTGFTLVCLSLSGLARPMKAAVPIEVASPDGAIKLELTATDGLLRYRVLVDGNQVLAPSTLGIRSDGIELGSNAVLGVPTFRSIDESYSFHGGLSTAVNQAREASVPVNAGGESFFVDLHVANDGVGVRLRLSAKQGRHVEADHSSWKLDGDPVVWVAKLQAAYESVYKTTNLGNLGTNSYGLPMTAKVGGLYITLTEALLKDYGDLAVKPGADGALEGYLYADTNGWTADDAVVQPWRVTIVARDLTTLVNTTLVENLNPPVDPSLAGADWIRPGRSTWQWMAVGNPKFEDQQQWVDWTKALGFEYYLVDEGWEHWKDPWASLGWVSRYAKTNGVKVWLWVNSKEVKETGARKEYFRKAAEIGIVGVKIDFPPKCDRWWSTWYYDTTKDAAACRLMVDFHGANKPTGMERTWPNAITREGIRGHEYHITRYKRVLEPQHDTILPFTRFIAGPADYTPTVFEPKELQGNTWGHELAQAVCFTSPFLCLAGHPKDYLANPARDVLMAMPAVWDETRVLPGSEPGKVAAMARRSGDQWFVGVMNGPADTTLDLPLNFLGPGTWKATRLADVPGKTDAWDRREDNATRTDQIKLTLSPRGGFVGWFRK